MPVFLISTLSSNSSLLNPNRTSLRYSGNDFSIAGFKLMDSFRAQVQKMKIPGIANRAEFDVGYPTGFLSLDFLNGTVIHVEFL